MNCEQIILKANLYENNGDYQSAWDLYIQTLYCDQYQDQYHLIYYEFANFLLRNRCYEEALQMFIKAYELNYKQQEILGIIDDVYYKPNISELKRIYTENTQALQSVYNNINIIQFEALTLKFIPVSDVKFYILDSNDKFVGDFSLESFNDNQVIASNEAYVIKNEYNKAIIKQYESLSRPIYLVYDDIEKFFSYLQVLPFSDIITHLQIKIFFTCIDFVNYFYKNKERLPQNIINAMQEQDRFLAYLRFEQYVKSENNTEKIEYPPISLKESNAPLEFQHSVWRKSREKILISFCIPTYSRGYRALENVSHILQLHDKEFEVVVCDNNSIDEDGGYRKLSLIQDPRLKYYKNDQNIGFAKNWLKTIERAQGKYVFILSDEDFVNLDTMPKLFRILRKNKEVALFKGSIAPKDNIKHPYSCSIQLDDTEYKKGYDALMNCSFTFNYVSGAIYNRDFIIKNKIFEKLERKIEEYDAYPHLYLDALLCALGKCKYLSDVICLEGKPEKSVNEQLTIYQHAYSFEGRLEQHVMFSKMIIEVFAMLNNKNIIQLANLYLKCCNKMAYLISCANGPFYEKAGRNLKLLIESGYYFCLIIAGEMFENIHLKSKIEEQIKLIFQDYWK